MATLEIPDALLGQTFMVRYSPNCPMAYEVRLSGMGILTSLCGPGLRSEADDVGYGHDLKTAAWGALEAREWRMSAPQRARDAALVRELWDGL